MNSPSGSESNGIDPGQPGVRGILSVTAACNQNCRFCCDAAVKKSGFHPTLEELLARVDILASQGASALTLIGGEPLVRRDLEQVVAHAKQKGLSVAVTTNGTLLTPDRLATLMSAGMSSLEISMHAVSTELASVISQRPDTRRLQLAALKAVADIRDARPGLALNYVVYSENYHELPQFVSWVAQSVLQVEDVFINFVDPIGYPAEDPRLVPTYTQIAATLKAALNIAENHNLPFTVDTVPSCFLGKYFLHSRAVKEAISGTRYAKDTFNIANPDPVPDNGQYYRVNACYDCPVNNLCQGVNFRYLQIHGPSEFRPFQAHWLDNGRPHQPRDLIPVKLDLADRTRWPALTVESVPGRLSGIDVSVPLTRQCNFNCPECVHLGQEPAVAPIERAMTLPSSSLVWLDGAEPPLHKGLMPLLHTLKKRGTSAGFVTNARLFAYPQRAEALRRLGHLKILLHLPGPLSMVNQITGVEAASQQIQSGLTNLLSIRTVYVKAEVRWIDCDIKEIIDTLEYLADRDIFDIVLSRPGKLMSPGTDDLNALRQLSDNRNLHLTVRPEGRDSTRIPRATRG